MNKELILKQSVVAVALACASSHYAMAQEATAADTQKVTVTGSNIKRTAKEGTSPIEMITAQDIRNSGVTTVTELMRLVPSMTGSGYGDTANQNGFSRGVSTASLRGLGSSSTLILLNGRRLTPSAYANPNNGQSAQYDLNAIPLSALERVEVFKDGASAVYGSDAIGGVINFITKRNYRGAELSASAAMNEEGKFGKNSVNGFVGAGDFEQDGYNLFGSFQFTKRASVGILEANDNIQAAQYRDINLRQIPYSSSTSNQPFFYPETRPGSLSFSTGAAPVNRTACDPSRLITGGPQYGITSGTLFNRTFCNYNIEEHQEAANAGTDAAVMGRATFRINASASAFVEGGFTRTKRTFNNASRTISGTSPTTNFITGGLAPTFQAILPVGHPDNPFPAARAAVAYRFENVPFYTDLQNDNKRLLAGLQGEFKGWSWETAVLWNQFSREEVAHGYLYLPVLRQITTRSLASLASDPNISKPLTNVGDSTITQWDGKVSTEFGHLRGGAIGFAAGLEVRQEKLSIDPDLENAAGNVLGLATTAIDGSRNVKSGYFEFRTPWLTNFEMDFAGRWDKYPTIKTNFVPKVGAKWTVTDSLAFRSTWAKGFRAPALSQVSPGGAQFFNTVNDPIRCPSGVSPVPGADNADCRTKSVSGVGGQNPDLIPEKSKSMSLGMIWSPLKEVDFLLDYYKIRKEGEVALAGAQFTIDHEKDNPGNVTRDTNPENQLKDAAGRPIPGTGPLLSVKTPWSNQGSTEVSGLDLELRVRNSLGAYGKLASTLRVAHYLTFKRAEKPGDYEANVVGTVGGTYDWATTVGAIPRVKSNLSTAWTFGDHYTTLGVNFVEGVSNLRVRDNRTVYPQPYCYYGTGQPSTATSLGGSPKYTDYYPKCATNSFTTVDLGYTYNGFKNLSLGINVQNILDTPAPYTPTNSLTSATFIEGYDAGLHSNLGRYIRVSATYTFK